MEDNAMGNLDITSLKTEYQKMVINNQQVYNPDFNGTLNETEIGVLLAATGVKDVKDLIQPVDMEEDLARRISEGIHIKKVVADGKLNGTYSGAGVGAGTGGVGVGAQSGTIRGDISRTVEMDFYEGQLITDVKESVFKDCFMDLDIDKNGKLTADEINSYKNYVKTREDRKSLDEEFGKCCRKEAMPRMYGSFAGVIGAIAGGLATNGILGKIVDYLSPHTVYGGSCKKDFARIMAEHKDHVLVRGELLVGTTPTKYKILRALIDRWESKTALYKGITAFGTVAGAALIGYGVYKLVSRIKYVKEAKEQMPQMETEIANSNNEINRLKEQYSHIYE